MTIRPCTGAVMPYEVPFESWQAEAAALDGVGAYSWMASRLNGPERVLEVGCGAGNGTLAMVFEGMRVVSVEPDPAAMRATLSWLRAHGVSAEGAMSLGAAASHAADVVVVCADFVDLTRAAPDLSAFGAVVCWNASAQVIPFSAPGQGDAGSSGMGTRLHRAVFAAAAMMAPGAMVHIVDRVSYPAGIEGAVRNVCLKRHAALAGSSVCVVPALSAIWPYRTTETIDAESVRARDAGQPPVTALVSIAGFVA